jgi:hypothetical protein
MLLCCDVWLDPSRSRIRVRFNNADRKPSRSSTTRIEYSYDGCTCDFKLRNNGLKTNLRRKYFLIPVLLSVAQKVQSVNNAADTKVHVCELQFGKSFWIRHQAL